MLAERFFLKFNKCRQILSRMAAVLVNHVICQNDSKPNCFEFGEKISTVNS